KEGEMTDIELKALTALVEMQRELCSADNQQRANNGYAPAWTGDCLPSDEEKALREELKQRGILSKETK
ncbi:hypothetical protein KKG36_02090, partial [Patescibacteria group bacterium]|nr:hypothetical protein [Patescibacteria group bacterium]